ncbi:vacuolar protein sorting-associated protein 41 [Macrolepiota fuliginosa MF-IS2]|uniref:Vacuolar protein sorting-associated protein 41 n=1 Tax=Macrolepiota fuliginosa MF-IS2 TaxID=1400762 RepID=A0A9P5XDJ0_9AGAR|nr:vacuolar protein sorting-associated protein 41 [Macrolepiota fuliginosa MF-IS2]
MTSPHEGESLTVPEHGQSTEGPTALTDESDNEQEQVEHQVNSHRRTEEEEGDGEDGDDDEDDEEDEEEDEEDEEDEDDDEEPALKYERITGAIPDLLKKDSASALAISHNLMALGTHAGIVHLLDLTGKRIKSYKPHYASIVDISLDTNADFVATASIDGQVVVHAINTTESYAFDMKRPMRTVALEPNFGRRNSRALVHGGLAGNLVLREKGWLGHKETLLHSGEGPIWQVRWRGRFIAWANDLGVKIYDHVSQMRITFIDRPPDSPRADLFKCTLHWQGDSTLLISWADFIKVARIRERPRVTTSSATANIPPFIVEITAVFQLDCMIAGIVPHPTPASPKDALSLSNASTTSSVKSTATEKRTHMHTPALTSFLILAYTPPETFTDEMTEDRARQARKQAERPELRIISRGGDELAADAISITDFQKLGCNDYVLVEGMPGEEIDPESRWCAVLSPRDLVRVRPRDRRDHVVWLVERQRYEEALEEVEKIEGDAKLLKKADVKPAMDGEQREGEEEKDELSAVEIGQKYIEHLVSEDEFVKAAKLTPKVCGHDPTRWENWIFVFAEKRQLQAIIPYVPTESPRLDHLVYEMMLAHFLTHDRQTLLRTIKDWPREIYDISAVIVAVRSELDKASTYKSISSTPTNGSVILMECLAELYTANRQPGKALPFYLRLRRPNVFELIREHNLFTDVQDQVLLLVEFDHELMEKRKATGGDPGQSEAIRLLVNNIHSIPIIRVVQQLQNKPYYLFLYLDALVERDPHLVSEFADLQVKLYAEFATTRLIDFLRASNYYNLEMAYEVCNTRNLVPEMVFLLGRMGNNKKALNLIIERMGDVQLAIQFAKEQSDDDLWEDLLKYSETRPAFIRGLLENVGAEISPVRLIRRIKDGLEIPGLKDALIRILWEFHLQIELLEGCSKVLGGDCTEMAGRLQRGQGSGFFLTAKMKCPVCEKLLQENPQSLLVLFLCRHVVHASCVSDDAGGSGTLESFLGDIGFGTGSGGGRKGIGASVALESMIKSRLRKGCPVCHKAVEGRRT